MTEPMTHLELFEHYDQLTLALGYVMGDQVAADFIGAVKLHGAKHFEPGQTESQAFPGELRLFRNSAG